MNKSLTHKINDLFEFFKDLLIIELNYNSVKATRALLFMTYRCTSCCKMCTIWRHGINCDSNEELNLEDWEKVIDELDEVNVEEFELFGGDSLLRKDVTIPLIEYIRKKNEKAWIDLPTNCNLLDKITAINLVKSGLDRIYISLDGPLEVHDKIRGKNGIFNNVQKALEYLIEAKKELNSKTPYIIINCVVSSLNLHNFEQILPVIEKIGVDGIDFEYIGEFKEENIQNSDVEGVKPTPFYITLGKSNLLNRDEAILLKKKMKDIKESAYNYKLLISTIHIDSLKVDDLVNGTIPNKKCYNCRNTVTIDPYGNVMGCLHYNNFIYGNIKDTSFSSIWRNNKHLSFLESQRLGKIKICKNCISGVNRNVTMNQSLYRSAYFHLLGKGFDSP